MIFILSNVLINLFTTLKQWDVKLFIKINSEWTNPFLDSVFPWWRDASTWIPVYLFLLIFLLLNFGWKVWPWIVFILLTITITDQLSSTYFKEWFNRVRPCNDQAMMPYVRLLLSHCPASQSFTSSHATNHFGAAVFIFVTLKDYLRRWGYLFFLWAATISYGQIYVGIHYPIDIIGGAIAGSLAGLLTSSIFNKWIKLPALRNN